MSPGYADFEIAIDPPIDQKYPVRVRTASGQEVRGTLVLPLTDPRYLAIQPKLEYPDPSSPASDDEILDLGTLLYETLLEGKIWGAFQSARTEAANQGNVLRIKLSIEPSEVEVAAFPWEFAADDAGFPLATEHSFCRYLPRADSLPAMKVAADQTLKLLITSALPKELVEDYPLDIEAEVAGIKQSLKALEDSGRLKIVELPHVTGLKLQRAIKDERPHIIHYVGHGTLEGENGVLVLEKDNGSQQNFSGRQLGVLLRGSSVKLVILNACKTGAVVTKLLRGIAPALMNANIPAVVAMQSSVQDDAGRAFAEEFYRALASGTPVDGCVAEGRKAIISCGLGNLDWGLATLYMRAPNGILFDGLGGVAAPAPKSEAAETSTSTRLQPAGGNSAHVRLGEGNTISGSSFNITNTAGTSVTQPTTSRRTPTPADREELEHLKKVKAKLISNLRTLESQAADHGIGNEPLHLVNSLSQTKDKLTEVEQKIAHLESLMA